MKIKNAQQLAAELRDIAPTLVSEHCRTVLLEAAERIEDTEKIAEFYRKQAEKGVRKRGRR